MAFDGEFLTEGVDPVQNAGFIKTIAVAEIEPGVVMQKGRIGTWPFSFKIGQKRTAQLPGSCEPAIVCVPAGVPYAT